MYIKKGYVFWSIIYFILSIQGEKISCKYATIKLFGLEYMQICFWSKINIWNVNFARATTFIFGTRTGFLVTVSKFLRQKSLDLRGTRTPNLRIHAECSNHWSYQGQMFAVPCFLILAQIFWSVNCACTRAYILDGTRHTERIQTYLKKSFC